MTSPTQKPGQLQVIATPIGNLNDLSPRIRQALSEVQLLACESLKSARRLYSALSLRLPRTILYREEQHSQAERAILEALQQGTQCGLISDSGTPAISDPGWKLVAACHQNQLPVTSLVGPCALSAALSVAGLPTRRFVFEGFPPHQRSARRGFFERLTENTSTTVFFESPHDILDALQNLLNTAGPERRLAICRELSKLHETNLLQTIAQWIETPPPTRGEFVLILEGKPVSEEPDPSTLDPQVQSQLQFLRTAGLSRRDLQTFLQTYHGQSRNQAYRLVLEE